MYGGPFIPKERVVPVVSDSDSTARRSPGTRGLLLKAPLQTHNNASFQASVHQCGEGHT